MYANRLQNSMILNLDKEIWWCTTFTLLPTCCYPFSVSLSWRDRVKNQARLVTCCVMIWLLQLWATQMGVMPTIPTSSFNIHHNEQTLTQLIIRRRTRQVLCTPLPWWYIRLHSTPISLTPSPILLFQTKFQLLHVRWDRAMYGRTCIHDGKL